MKIKYKIIEHERNEDAPFVSALICADGCKFKCKGCFNRHLKKLPTKIASAEEIIAEVKNNPFNYGITLAGLEWSEQAREMVELVKVADENGLKVMIYTGCDSLLDFHLKIGKQCAGLLNMSQFQYPLIAKENDSHMYALIGAMILDTYIKGTYYIKVGKYDETKKVNDNVQFDVKLDTSNQIIFKIEGDK